MLPWAMKPGAGVVGVVEVGELVVGELQPVAGPQVVDLVLGEVAEVVGGGGALRPDRREDLVGRGEAGVAAPARLSMSCWPGRVFQLIGLLGLPTLSKLAPYIA